jgi:outer membrane lipoprotein SlyB
MKRGCVLILCIGLILLGTGCQSNKSRVAEGSVIGGVLGAAAGAGIGSLSGNAGAGAGIGAAVGAIGGGLIGSQIEKKPGQDANPNQMTLQQVIDLVKQGTGDDIIIEKLRATNSKFSLSAAQISSLKQQGVSQKVIEAMQAK